jgi:hypothetical protein
MEHFADGENLQTQWQSVTNLKTQANVLRARLKSFQKYREKSQFHNIQRILQVSLAVFPKKSAFIKPPKRPLDNPTLRDYGECM